MVGGAAEAVVAERIVGGSTPTAREGAGVVDRQTEFAEEGIFEVPIVKSVLRVGSAHSDEGGGHVR